MEPTILIEAWKVGGLALVLLLLLVVVLWIVWKALRSDNRRMAAALDKCQDAHTAMATSTATLIANNNNLIAANTEATRMLCDVMRDRPCLKDPTPARPHPSIPDIHPPNYPR